MKALLYRLLLIFLYLLSCNGQVEKVNGVSYVATRNAVNQTHITPVIAVNANYAAVMPFAYIKNLHHPVVHYNSDKQWYGETEDGVRNYISELQKQNIKIMMKPQIWVWRGEFTGDIEMTSDEDWQTFEETYSTFILAFAKIAERTKTELFCIGTELERFVKHRPHYWKSLIKDIRQVYSGQLTYAANWDEYIDTPFWSSLDYIGVDAYFPVSNAQTPTVADCMNGWQTHKTILKKAYDTYQRPILFTEFGYRSTDYTGKTPWNVDYSITNVNLEAQTNATEALFKTFWCEDWFAGGFLWKWFPNHNDSGGVSNARFTPQNKPAQDIIKDYYTLHSH